MRALRVWWTRAGFSTRRQNFFEGNPIYPQGGEKDFDVYNDGRKRVNVAEVAIEDVNYRERRDEHIIHAFLTEKMKDSFHLSKMVLDDETGLPFGIKKEYDEFINVFRRTQKIGKNIEQEYGALITQLMDDMKVDTEVELIKRYRFTIAQKRLKQIEQGAYDIALKDAIALTAQARGSLVEVLKEGTQEPLSPPSLSSKDKDILDRVHCGIDEMTEGATKEVETMGVDEARSREIIRQMLMNILLRQLDEKIARVEQSIKDDVVETTSSNVSKYHPKYGVQINESLQYNLKYDLSTQLGVPGMVVSSEGIANAFEEEDVYIERKIRQQYFFRRDEKLDGDFMDSTSAKERTDLPIYLRTTDAIVNALAFKYRQEDVAVEPDVEDIYAEMDIALEGAAGFSSSGGPTLQEQSKQEPQVLRVCDQAHYLWDSLQVREIYSIGEYDQSNLKNISIEESQIRQLSPHPNIELSLNRLPFNLYRHEDMEIFGAFQKEKAKIYQDFVNNKTMDNSYRFKRFSLAEITAEYRKETKKESSTKKMTEGAARRKTARAEVSLKEGTGKVTINHRPLGEYFANAYHRGEALKPFIFTETAGQFDADILVAGGGIHGQAECIATALARAIVILLPKHKDILEGFGLLQSDNRLKEPKKIGLYSARKRPPYVRR